MVIRPARPDERLTLIALQRRASLMHADSHAALVANPDAIDLPPEHIADTLVADEAGRALGFCVASRTTGNSAELDGLFVEPDVWRAGIGRALVMAVAKGRALTVVANPNVLEFYTGCGFATTGTTATRFGPAISMTRPSGD